MSEPRVIPREAYSSIDCPDAVEFALSGVCSVNTTAPESPGRLGLRRLLRSGESESSRVCLETGLVALLGAHRGTTA